MVLFHLRAGRSLVFRNNIRRWLLLWWMLFLLVGNDAAETEPCPEECTCRIISDAEEGSLLKIICTRGDMHILPVHRFDRGARIIIISPPKDQSNYLTIGPIFTQPPFIHLRELHIVNSHIPMIGKYAFWGLPELRYLNLTHNNLTSLNIDNFRGLLNLTDLHLAHNKIEQMPSETFRNAPALNTLVLAHNRIYELVPRLFRMLAKLTYLDLSYNPLPELNPEVFKDVTQVKVLKCRRCLLRRINPQIYHLLPRIEELDLGENQFKYLTPDEFVILKKLKILELDGNQLSVVVDNMFARNRDLQTLNLAHNRLALLAPNALINLTGLVHLDISHNKIDRFHLQTFSPVVESLKAINFSGNNLPLNEIAIVLQILPDIEAVSVANLSLPVIPPLFFTYNEHLREVDISWNKLTKFPLTLLTRTRFLQKLDISHNKLETLSEEDMQRLEAIADINLSKNSWKCDQCSAGNMLVFMTTSVLNKTIRELRCYSPMRLKGKKFIEMTYDKLELCPSAYESHIHLIAGSVLVGVSILAVVAVFLCCKRRRAQYYTNEEKRCEHEHEHPDQLMGQTEINNVATIHTPYHLVSRSS
ncbi:hypothetical protein ACJJTC_000646 [Scirpophaga incertulas]